MLLSSLAGVRPASATGDPQPGTVTVLTSQILYPATALTDTGEVTSDAINVGNWYAADVFVSVDISGTGAVTVTPQFAVNDAHWSDAEITYAAWEIVSAPPTVISTTETVTETSDAVTVTDIVTETVTVTDTEYTTTTITVLITNTVTTPPDVITITNNITQTSDFDVSGESTIATTPRQIVLTADGSQHLRLPVAGNQMRVKIEWTGTVTPTVTAVLRNN